MARHQQQRRAILVGSSVSASRLGLAEPQCEKEAATSPGLALHPQFPAMMLHQPPRDGQSQTRSLANSFGGRASLPEAFKDRLLILGGNADSGVANLNTDGL